MGTTEGREGKGKARQGKAPEGHLLLVLVVRIVSYRTVLCLVDGLG